MKHLKIEYTTEGGTKIVLWDAEVAEVTWSDGSGVVRVEGKTKDAANGSGMNLLELLTGKRTADDDDTAESRPEKKTTRARKGTAALKTVAADEPTTAADD